MSKAKRTTKAESTKPDTEFVLQSYVSTQLKRLGILHHGDQNSAKRSLGAGARAKASGMCKGWPDMCIVCNGVLYWIEYKTATGKLSNEQIEVGIELRRNGQRYEVVAVETKEEAWMKTRTIIGL